MLGSSNMNTDQEDESIEKCVDRYKAEPKIDIEECPLQWWLKRERAHARLAHIVNTCNRSAL